MRPALRSNEPRLATRPGVAMAIMVGALIAGSLLNAEPLADTAASQPAGWQRTFAVAATDAMVEVSDALLLDEPHDAVSALLGRDGDGPVDQEPPAPSDVFVPTAERPARLWIAGDSLVETIGAAVVNAAAATDVIAPRFDVQFSSGLARPELYDWPRRAAEELLTRPADIVVFMVGANDGQAIETAGGFAGFGSEEWRAEYSVRVGEMMDTLGARTATVYWIGLPIAADERLAERFRAMNEVFRAEAERRERVAYLDLYSAFAGPAGEYRALLEDEAGRLIRVRDPDGIHFTPAGAELVADRILALIAETWQLAP